VRWEELFADLERQWQALAEEERQAEIADRTRAALAQVPLADRLRGSEGAEVRVLTRSGHQVDGTLARVGADFVLLSQPRHECVLAVAAIAAVSGLRAEAVSAQVAGPVRSRLGLGSVLRGVAADRSRVTLTVTGGPALTGTVQRVGADFLEVAEHGADDLARPDRVRRLTVVPFGSVETLRRETPYLPDPR
jgi:hypothetical protein